MKTLINEWRSDKLKTTVTVFWLLTVFFCFFGSTVLLVKLPGLPALYPFRVLLPVTTLLHLVWLIREKRNPWKIADFTQRTAYILCAVLLVYSTLSLTRAIDFEFTFTLWITLCFDLVFFALMIDLCSDKKRFVATVRCALITLLIHMVMGGIEIVEGGFFNTKFDEVFFFFGVPFASPSVSTGNPNDYAMMLVFMLALMLLYWAWHGYPGKKNWIPVLLIAPVYGLIFTTLGRLCTLSFWILMVPFALYTLTSKERILRVLVPTVVLLSIIITFLSYGSSIPVGQTKLQQKPVPVSAEIEIPDLDLPLAEDPEGATVKSTAATSEALEQKAQIDEILADMDSSGAVRLKLLLHALRCFIDSKGMGVGLGNTAQLAKTTAESRGGVWGIHCFLARMAADFGIFFLIPLLLIAFKMLQFGIAFTLREIKKRNWENAMTGALYLASVLIYPIASTAPGDAQNVLPMWLFMGSIVLFPVHVRQLGEK